MAINIIIGGRILIIFVGGATFKIVPVVGKAWGLSIGLGTTSIRGPRVREHIGLRQRMHKARGKASGKHVECYSPLRRKWSQYDGLVLLYRYCQLAMFHYHGLLDCVRVRHI